MTAINYGDVNGKHTEKPIDVLPGKSRKTTEVADLTLPNIIEVSVWTNLNRPLTI